MVADPTPPEATLRSRLVAGLCAGVVLAVALGYVVGTGRADAILDRNAQAEVAERVVQAADELQPYLEVPDAQASDGIAPELIPPELIPPELIRPELLAEVAAGLGVTGGLVVRSDDTVVSSGPGTDPARLADLATRLDDSDPAVEPDEHGGDAWIGATRIVLGPGRSVVVGVFDEPLGTVPGELSLVRMLSMSVVAILAVALVLVVVRLLLRPFERLVARVRTAEVDRRHAAAKGVERVEEAGGRYSIRFRDDHTETIATPSLGDEFAVIESAIDGLQGDLQQSRRTIERQQSALAEATRRVVAGQDETRRQLAGELHDGIQQQLVMLRLELSLARTRLAKDPAGEDRVFAELSDKVDTMLARLRDTARGVYPAILRDRGLHEALTSLARQSNGRVRVTAAPRPFPRLDLDVEANTYFLVAESVSNALKHAGPEARVDIDLVCDPERLRVRVRDDGHGFVPDAAGGGRGLANQRDRAAALGGQVEIVSGSTGTTVLALLPRGGGRPRPDPAVRRRRPLAGFTAGDVSAASLEVQQDGDDPPVEVDVVLDVEFPEDRRDVLLDGPFHDVEFGPDSGVALAGGHQGDDLVLPRGERIQSP